MQRNRTVMLVIGVEVAGLSRGCRDVFATSSRRRRGVNAASTPSVSFADTACRATPRRA
jgi:hypothetical protein